MKKEQQQNNNKFQYIVITTYTYIHIHVHNQSITNKDIKYDDKERNCFLSKLIVL